MIKLFTSIFCAVFIINSFAIIPPKKGVTPPAGFSELKKNIEKDYHTGYFARKMDTRQLLRERIAKGELSKDALVTDTVFALTLLGKYSDSQPIYSAQSFQAKLFDGPSSTGTLRDFYSEISYGQMYMSGKCVGWNKVPGTLDSYVGTNNGLGAEGGARFVWDLVKSCDSTINYADYIQYYDAQGNPRIGFIAAVHTGADAAAGAHNIWSHRWTFTVYSHTPYTSNDIDPVSGKHVIIDGDYAIEPELTGASNNSGNLIEIGVFAHEFGHIFGLPDLYDTDYSSEGLGNWCLMAGGAYGGNGSTAFSPAHMSAWCKVKLGWVTPIEITSIQKNKIIPDVEDSSVIYKLRKINPQNNTEYFLVENRQLIGFDKYLYIPGLLIYHVDELSNGNWNEDHPIVDLEQADGLRNLNHGQGRGDIGDPFPGSTLNRRFDVASNPNSSLYDLSSSYVSVRNISLSGLNAIADFDIGTMPYIQLQITDIKETIPQNGRVEPGEMAGFTLKIKNLENVGSAQTKIKFLINEPDIQLLRQDKTFTVSPLQNNTVTLDSVITVSANFAPRMIYVKYQVISENNSFIDSAKVTIGFPKVLIISKAEKSQFTNYYFDALRAAGIEPEETYNMPAQFLSKRETIICLTGQTKDSIFTQSEVDSLTAFSSTGGNLILSGQNLAEYLSVKYPSFLNNHIGINWVKNGSIFYKNVYGITGDPLGAKVGMLMLLGTDGARNEKSPDVLSANGNFNMAFSYKQNLIEGAGGYKTLAGGGKIIFLGFGFESVSNVESSISRTEFMRVLLSQLGMAVAVNDNNNMPADFSLSQNYPNPFNPSTVISYSLAKESDVKLDLYDITGQRIAQLVNKTQQQGNYNIIFNSKDFNLSSGIYFYKITAGSFSSVKKLVLLK